VHSFGFASRFSITFDEFAAIPSTRALFLSRFAGGDPISSFPFSSHCPLRQLELRKMNWSSRKEARKKNSENSRKKSRMLSSFFFFFFRFYSAQVLVGKKKKYKREKRLGPFFLKGTLFFFWWIFGSIFCFFFLSFFFVVLFFGSLSTVWRWKNFVNANEPVSGGVNLLLQKGKKNEHLKRKGKGKEREK
jgi:hypothetical protein